MSHLNHNKGVISVNNGGKGEGEGEGEGRNSER